MRYFAITSIGLLQGYLSPLFNTVPERGVAFRSSSVSKVETHCKCMRQKPFVDRFVSRLPSLVFGCRQQLGVDDFQPLQALWSVLNVACCQANRP